MTVTVPNEALFADLFAAAPHAVADFFAGLVQNRGGRFAKIVEENLDIIESVEDMHRLVRMSASHFHRRFRAHYGIAPKRWLLERKLEKRHFF